MDDKKLGWALCHYCAVDGSKVNAQSLTLEEATAARDSLIHGLYSRLLDTIIELINAKLAPKVKYVLSFNRTPLQGLQI